MLGRQRVELLSRTAKEMLKFFPHSAMFPDKSRSPSLSERQETQRISKLRTVSTAIMIANPVSDRSRRKCSSNLQSALLGDGQGGMPSRQIMLRRLSGINKQDVRKARKEMEQ